MKKSSAADPHLVAVDGPPIVAHQNKNNNDVSVDKSISGFLDSDDELEGPSKQFVLLQNIV